MPNWCDNSVRLTHSDKSKIDALEAVLQSEDKQVFQHLRPSSTGEWEYDWSVTNWGTKWEMSVIDWDRSEDNTIWISFETAWAPPLALYEFLHSEEWEIEGFYHEPGMTFCGCYKDGYDDYYEYDISDLESLESIPSDIEEFAGLIDYHHDHIADQEAEAEWEAEEAKKTEWYPADVNPYHMGRYEAKDPKIPNWPFPEYANWDGKKWINDEGKKIKVASWRGLKEEPLID